MTSQKCGNGVVGLPALIVMVFVIVKRDASYLSAALETLFAGQPAEDGD
jgi:hypothetical protein